MSNTAVADLSGNKMSSVYMYVNFRVTKTVSLNVKLLCNDSLETASFIARPCLFIPLQEKSTVTQGSD